jgi:hypothetical protein
VCFAEVVGDRAYKPAPWPAARVRHPEKPRVYLGGVEGLITRHSSLIRRSRYRDSSKMVPIPVISYLNSAPCRFGVVRGDQYVAAVSTSNSEAMPSAMLVSTERLGRAAKKQLPLCAPRPPKCGGQEKARDFVRDDTYLCVGFWGRGSLWRNSQNAVFERVR